MKKDCPRQWCHGVIEDGGRCPECGFPDRETIVYLQNWIKDLEVELIHKKIFNQVDYHAAAWKIKVLKNAVGWWEDLQLCKEKDRGDKNETP